MTKKEKNRKYCTRTFIFCAFDKSILYGTLALLSQRGLLSSFFSLSLSKKKECDVNWGEAGMEMKIVWINRNQMGNVWKSWIYPVLSFYSFHFEETEFTSSNISLFYPHLCRDIIFGYYNNCMTCLTIKCLVCIPNPRIPRLKNSANLSWDSLENSSSSSSSNSLQQWGNYRFTGFGRRDMPTPYLGRHQRGQRSKQAIPSQSFKSSPPIKADWLILEVLLLLHFYTHCMKTKSRGKSRASLHFSPLTTRPVIFLSVCLSITSSLMPDSAWWCYGRRRRRWVQVLLGWGSGDWKPCNFLQNVEHERAHSRTQPWQTRTLFFASDNCNSKPCFVSQPLIAFDFRTF